MNAEESRHIRRLIDEYTKRLRVLEIQVAKFGEHCPAYVLVEVDSISQRITQLSNQLEQGTLSSFPQTKNALSQINNDLRLADETLRPLQIGEKRVYKFLGIPIWTVIIYQALQFLPILLGGSIIALLIGVALNTAVRPKPVQDEPVAPFKQSPSATLLSTSLPTASILITPTIGIATTVKTVSLISIEKNLSSAVWSPNSKQIVTTSADAIDPTIWVPRTGNLLTSLWGHTGAVNRAAWSPDGKHIVTASDDTTARVWAADGTFQFTLQGHTDRVNWASWSPDGKHIVTASDDTTARVWAADGTLLATLQGHTARVNQVAWSPDGQQIVSTSDDGTAKVWAADGTLLATLQGHTARVTQAAWSPDGSHLIPTASDDGTARVWDAASGKAVQILEGHTGAVTQAAWSPDGTRILTSDDKTARIWDAASGKAVQVLEGHTGAVTQAAWSPDGTRFLTSDDNTTKVWGGDGTLQAKLNVYARATQTAWSPDGTHILIASPNGIVVVWEVPI
ncbi:hypothetical protein SE17_08070 [Kouleothrix aurantiaca]|uniref:Uncharacterized protein n=1 Tax=Kouleothrix aurantiaca TaxID=186479 RepID=A0A0P9HG10_9CHLR|nr:hypothetical protein SE17_08070 [Kouleothrix aurantiaca]